MANRSYSVENLFRTILAELPADCHPTVLIGTRESSGFLNRLAAIVEARKQQLDVNHVAGDVHYLTYLLQRRKTLLTILDYNHVRRSALQQWMFTLLWFRIPVRRAQIIAAISEFTKDEVVRVTGCRPSLIRVVPCCVDPAFVRKPRSFNVARPVILQVGTSRNKNVERLMQALDGIPCTLHLVGEMTSSQRAILRAISLECRNSVGLSAEQLRAAYEEADIVTFASTYEGFGLPIIEAQAVGRPVLTSDLRPMRDVAGGGAYLVDPYDIASIRAGITRLINDVAYRESTRDKGFENVERYSAKRVASLYADLYRELAAANVPMSRAP